MANDPGPWWLAIASVVIGGLIASITALVTQLYADRSSRRLEGIKLQGTLYAEDYKNIPARQIRDASRQLEQQLRFAKQRIGQLASDSRSGIRSLASARLRDLFALAYDIHAPKAVALRLCELYEDRAESAMGQDETVAQIWPIVELLNELFDDDEALAKVAPPFPAYRRRAAGEPAQYLPAEIFAKQMIGPKGIASRGAFEQRLANGNVQLVDALKWSREVFARFSPERSPVLWRVLLCEALLCDVLTAVRSGADPAPASWPHDAETRVLLTWRDGEAAAACEPEFAAARSYVEQRLRELRRDRLPPAGEGATLPARWSRPADPEQAQT